MSVRRVKYFSPHRPLTPGTFPKRPDLRVTDVTNFDEPLPIKGCPQLVWGWVEYDGFLTDEEIEQYELVPQYKSKVYDSMRRAKRAYRDKTHQMNVTFTSSEEDMLVLERIKEKGRKAYIVRLVMEDIEREQQAKNPKPEVE